MAGGEKAR